MSRVDEALKIINKLMSDGDSSEETEKRIALMFKIIEHEEYPPVIVPERAIGGWEDLSDIKAPLDPTKPNNNVYTGHNN